MPVISDDKLKGQFYLIDGVIERNGDVWRSDLNLEVIRVVIIAVALDLFLEGGVIRVQMSDLGLQLLHQNGVLDDLAGWR